MESIRIGATGQMYRLWITTYADWRPAQWSDAPPTATALEAVENGLYSADEAALFLEGFNSAVLQNNDPIWAVAVPVTIRYEGDAQPGMPIRGHAFPCDGPAIDVTDRQGNPLAAGSDTLAAGSDALAAGREPAQAGASADPLQANHFQGFGQSPQRSR
jgi:hypothetical protein